MACKVKGNQKHLSEENREYIVDSLTQNITLREIAEHLVKDPTTISKEIKKHRIKAIPNSFNNKIKNQCVQRYRCVRKQVCGSVKCNKRCSTCINCNLNCKDFKKEICKQIIRAPFVCNGCSTKRYCPLEKYFYRSRSSHKEYRERLNASREGINLTKDELSNLDELITPLIKRGQSIAHIYASHTGDISCSRRTLYRYVDKKLLSVSNIDLPRKVRYKKRKKKSSDESARGAYRKGRTYEEFLSFTAENPQIPVIEMDTVEGVKGGKVLLTFLFRSCNLMLCFILDNKTQKEVICIFNQLERLLGSELFSKVFPILLGDHGSEFLDPTSLETGLDGNPRTRVFYCTPYASYQKGALEKNHEFIRYIVPKGHSFDSFMQSDILRMVNHINSTARDTLNSHTPYEIAALLIPEFVLELLNLEKIQHDDVLLKPKLLRK